MLTLGASLAAAGNGVGRLGAGALADRLGVRASSSAARSLAAVALLGLAAGPGPAVAAAGLAVSGIAYGVVAVGYPVAAARYYGAEHTTAVYARIFTAWGLAGITAPVAAGRAVRRDRRLRDDPRHPRRRVDPRRGWRARPCPRRRSGRPRA